ncbi:hypothetical protein L1987_84376 [Smallanthus sonchifolius]|uniref:Uncharacterized protein n=1 Tax=Smallanthus sonchifolius TaxID=185202 RepID=A0ACB8YF85_9ASTR|nr:hypothetical protein L1987_84376 [Smallanthus sonchifolius]
MEFKTFPQPTRPLSYSNLTSFKYSTSISQHSKPITIKVSEPSTSTSNLQQPDGDVDELFHELIRILFKCLENTDNVTKGLLLRKVFLELEKESQMENFIVEKLKCSHVKVICDFIERYPKSSIGEDEIKYDQQETGSRGFKEDLMEAGSDVGSKAEWSHKLERFKVKTIAIVGGVIKR